MSKETLTPQMVKALEQFQLESKNLAQETTRSARDDVRTALMILVNNQSGIVDPSKVFDHFKDLLKPAPEQNRSVLAGISGGQHMADGTQVSSTNIRVVGNENPLRGRG